LFSSLLKKKKNESVAYINNTTNSV
jgi:hypothetical protein